MHTLYLRSTSGDNPVRVIEGELERTIVQMDAVDTARVSVVIPEQRLFLEQQKPSTASVLQIGRAHV